MTLEKKKQMVTSPRTPTTLCNVSLEPPVTPNADRMGDDVEADSTPVPNTEPQHSLSDQSQNHGEDSPLGRFSDVTRRDTCSSAATG